ncbi:PLD nuclease N-terminal domain-containing protein [Microbacterium sp.]|uniref:PLD nuclease N-terminal domain-containing protein n=1 Tax=Microbacterium sp. TaxID=51671 RepID=UPI003A88CCAF
MARVLIPLTLLLVAFWIYSIVDCAMQPPTRHRGVSKPAWMLIVMLFPVFGGVLWFTVGRPERGRPQPPRAPDDNPEVLGSIGSTADQDERIRRLEEELAALDAEDDDPRWRTHEAGAPDAADRPAAPAADPDPDDPDAAPEASPEDDGESRDARS